MTPNGFGERASLRPRWLKLHLAFEAGSGRVVAVTVTGRRRHDAAALPDLVERMEGRIDIFLADGAHGDQPTYERLMNRRQGLPLPRVIAPPTSPEQVPPDKLDSLRQRDRHIAHIQEHGIGLGCKQRN